MIEMDPSAQWFLGTGQPYQDTADNSRPTLARADEVIEAGPPNAHERLLLGMPEHTPVLGTSRLTFTDKGQPIEYVRAAYQGDKYQLRVSLHGTNKPHRS
jgi:DNA-binding GntR family transcriptional regulator